MIYRVLWLAAALLILAPIQGIAQEGLQLRVDRSTNAADPDDVPEVTLTTVGDGFQVETGPAAVVWNDGDSADGTYTLSAKLTLQEPSGHVNYYGLVFGGRDLDSASQNYLYFLIAQNGTYIVKHRANDDTVHDLVDRTEHDAIVQPDDGGSAVNELEVRVGADEVAFVVNGTVVHTQARTGMAARTDGIFGVRVNHRIPGVLVEGLGAN